MIQVWKRPLYRPVGAKRAIRRRRRLVIDVDDFQEDVESVNDDPPSPIQPCSSQGSTSFFSPPSSNDAPDHCSENSKESCSAILAPIPTPRCKVHNELAKEFTVKKPGPNKGKLF